MDLTVSWYAMSSVNSGFSRLSDLIPADHLTIPWMDLTVSWYVMSSVNSGFSRLSDLIPADHLTIPCPTGENQSLHYPVPVDTCTHR